jgi:hypothetical protein
MSHRPISEDTLVNLNARVPKSLWRRVRVTCTQRGQLLRHFITEALRDRLRETKRRHAKA